MRYTQSKRIHKEDVMNTIKKQCHLKAISENLELGLIGGLLASAFDSLWVVMDMIHNGIHLHYVLILSALVVSTIMLTVALIRHHNSNVKNHMGMLYNTKKQLNKYKMRHRREHK